jgi:hypothetical protein
VDVDFWTAWGTTLVSTVVGAAVTWVAARHYFKRAGDELRHESQQLRKLVSMVLTAMEQQGTAKLNRDAEGNIIGFVFEHVGSGGVKVGGSAPTEFIPANRGNGKEGDA